MPAFPEGERRSFSGRVIRRDPNDYGLVLFDPSDPSEQTLGFFTHETMANPAASRQARVGRTVKGRAVKFGESYKILAIEV